MEEIYKLKVLSESTDGKAIKVDQTSGGGSGTDVHTTSSGKMERVTLVAYNTDSSARTLSVEWGGTTADDTLSFDLEANSEPRTIFSGLLGGTGTYSIAAYASAANVVYILGQSIEVEEQTT